MEEIEKQGTEEEKYSKGRIRSWMWALAGFICFGVGCIGVVLPILPTTPFILVAAFCFARSSRRVNDWFKSTKLYHQVIEGYATKRMMTVKAKLTIIIPVTILLGFAVYFMRNVPVWAGVLVVVWLCHIVYFGFMVKTDHDPQPESAVEADEGAAE